jgi:hypothetical protein
MFSHNVDNYLPECTMSIKTSISMLKHHVRHEVQLPLSHFNLNLTFPASARFPRPSMIRAEITMENKRLSGATGENGTNGNCKFCVKFNFSKFNSHH